MWSLSLIIATLMWNHVHCAVTIEPPMTMAAHGETVNFTCNSMYAVHKYIWLTTANISMLANATSYASILSNVDNLTNLTVVDTGSVLTLSNVNSSFGGTYYCAATNEMSTIAFNTANLFITPKITVHPMSSNYTVGASASSLTCRAESFPAPEYYWENLKSSDYVKITKSEGSSYPIATVISYGTNGYFRCIAYTNVSGIVNETASDPAIISVSPAGSVFIILSPKTASGGDNRTIICSAQGGPDNVISFIHNGAAISYRGRFDTTTPGRLVITGVVGEDHGIYTCLVTNLAGSDTATASLAVSPEGFSSISPVNNVTLNRGDDITLQCTTTAGPGIKYKWAIGNVTGIKLAPSIGTNSALILSSVNASHGGPYSCFLSNTAGTEAVGTDVFISPYFIEQLPAITGAAVGENVTLDCNAESYPSPTFHWEKNNNQGHYATLPGETSRYLELTSVTVDVFGDYRCIASIQGSTATSNVATVQAPITCTAEFTSSHRGVFAWPETPINSTANISCPNGPTGAMANRRCAQYSIWELFNATSCATTAVTNGFRNISTVDITVNNIVSISQNISDLVTSTTDTADQNTDNIIVVSGILNQTASLLSDSIIFAALSHEEVFMMTENTMQILDDIEEWPPNVVKMESNKMVKSFERTVDALLSQGNFTNTSLAANDIVLRGEKTERSVFSGIVGFSSFLNNSLMVQTQKGEDLVNTQGSMASIVLPQSILSINRGNDVNVAFTIYKQTLLFPVRGSPPSTVIGSLIISASIGGVADGTKLPDPVIASFALSNLTDSTYPHCVYWDFAAAGGNGNWSTDGCTTTINNDPNSVTCRCDHLTNFACLLGAGPSTKPPHYAAITLEIVTCVAVGLSLLVLVLTIVSLIIFKKTRTKDASKFHIQLCLSLCFMLLVFVAGIDRVSVRAGCITVGVLIHYFALVSWMFIGAEAVLLFHQAVIVLSKMTWAYLLVFSIISWTLPLLPIVATLAVNLDIYVYLHYGSNHQIGFCFIRDIVPFIVAFLLPIIFILLFTLVLYFLIIVSLMRHNVTKESKQASLTATETIKMLALFSGIMILFGLILLFAIFSFVTDDPKVSFIVQFFLALFIVVQGFFIFFFLVVLNGDARNG